ncbi:Amidinotransferase family protein, partial [Pseudomonas amygdali pv. ciccaronei]
MDRKIRSTMSYQKAEPAYFTTTQSPVEVYTEWDPLEEVIVGIMDDIRVPDWDLGLKAIIPKESSDFFMTYSGRRFPEELLVKARQEVNTLARILET